MVENPLKSNRENVGWSKPSLVEKVVVRSLIILAATYFGVNQGSRFEDKKDYDTTVIDGTVDVTLNDSKK